jgi:GNAT superfamily N-acetyltransferase
MNLLIRKCREDDIKELLRLNYQWGYETTLKQLTDQLKRIDAMHNAAVFVAESKNIVVGRIFLIEHITFGSEPFVEVHGLVVDENFRMLGIGKALIEKAKEWGQQRGFKVLRLRTNVNRAEANLFYPAIGFTLEKQQNVFAVHL